MNCETAGQWADCVHSKTRFVIYLWVPTGDMEAARLACEDRAALGGWTLVGFHADHSIKQRPDLAGYALDDCRTGTTDRVVTTRASLERMGVGAAGWIREVEAAGCLVVAVDAPPGGGRAV
jgi:hypothetical protein